MCGGRGPVASLPTSRPPRSIPTLRSSTPALWRIWYPSWSGRPFWMWPTPRIWLRRPKGQSTVWVGWEISEKDTPPTTNVLEGTLPCPEPGRLFPISGRILNMMLSDEKTETQLYQAPGFHSVTMCVFVYMYLVFWLDHVHPQSLTQWHTKHTFSWAQYQYIFFSSLKVKKKKRRKKKMMTNKYSSLRKKTSSL